MTDSPIPLRVDQGKTGVNDAWETYQKLRQAEADNPGLVCDEMQRARCKRAFKAFAQLYSEMGSGL